nr:ARID DNA-binding domain-containing protein [Tanacetum cinerariifolium]
MGKPSNPFSFRRNTSTMVVGKVKKKASGAARLWMRFDSSGESEVFECDKSTIIKRAGIPPRDLRILGPVFSNSCNILGEVLIKDGNKGYLIPGGNGCTLQYMFKNQQGQNLDIDKMRQRHNDFLDDYFESLDTERIDGEGEESRFVEDTNASEVHTFQEFVAFLNLIKNDDVISKGWDIYRNRFDKVLKWFYNHYLKRPLSEAIPPIIHGIPIHLFDLYKLIDCMGGYLSVQFGQEFSALAEILGLTRSDGEEIRKCYITYLDVFTSYYKTARAPEDPTKEEKEDSESLESYQWNGGKTCAPIVVEKGKEKLEHFGIKLEKEEDCKEQHSTYYRKDKSQITCYK